MLLAPGYAEAPDTSNSALVFILVGSMLMVLAGGLALFPLAIARRRGSRQSRNIATFVILWGLLVGGTLIYFVQSQMQWNSEYTTRVESGYFDPQDTSGAPRPPWTMAAALTVGYFGLMAWAMLSK
jgi:hypothetical protein